MLYVNKAGGERNHDVYDTDVAPTVAASKLRC